MAKPLNILIVEDSRDDADLILAQLRHDGFDPVWKRVETEHDFLVEIHNRPDIVLSDFSLPRFTGLRAAELLQASGLNIPFILISGTVGEEIAVEAMKHGATDYLLKDRIVRLGSAVQRALEQKRLRDEHQRAEAALDYERDLLRMLLDNSPDYIYFKDTQSRFVKCCRALAVQFGAESPEALVGRTDFDFFDESHARSAHEDEKEIIRTGRPMIGKEEREDWKTGEVRWVSSTKMPWFDNTGKIIGIIGISRDITEHRKLEAQFHQAQKMESFGQLAGGVAHDFNNILSVIQLQAGLLKSELNLSPGHLEVAGDIEMAAERGSNLTRQLLLFSRKQTMQPKNLNLKDVVTSMTRMLQRTLGEQIQLQFKFSNETLVIHADPGMIDQILLNLTVNARDAMPHGGQIVIEIAAVTFDGANATQSAKSRPGSFACLSVTDAGSGIPPEILPRIFEPFFTTKEVGKGTGLGLATVFGIVQQHKGWIDVDSEVGRGSTFRVYLPLMADGSDTDMIRLAQTPVRGGHETILLVEDESALRACVRTALSRLGYRVLEASAGGEALTVWNQHRDEIRLLLTDMVMPGGMTGMELARQLLQQDPKLKVIYASGYCPEGTDKDFLLEEGVNFLIKPFQTHRLAQAIRCHLDQK